MKQWKRLAALSSAIVMAAATLTYFPNDTLQNIRLEISASADETGADETSAATWTKTESDGLTWTLDYDGKLTISGTGAMKDYDYNNNQSPVYMNSSVKKVVIEDGVTSIGNWAFYKCTSLTTITIPDSVTSIGEAAFRGCSSLTSITIPDSVTSIGDAAFSHCSNLKSITIPDSITSIGKYAFCNCSSLTSITIPNSVTSIGESALAGCVNLTSITIPKSVTSIGSGVFDGCNNLTVYLESGSTLTSNDLGVNESKIGSYWVEDNLTWKLDADGTLTISGTGAMKDYDYNNNPSPANQKKGSVKKVVIKDGVTSIGKYAFCNCSNLKSITILDSVTSIGDFAFSDCSSLTSITIPDSVTSIGDFAFSGCSSLTSITIPDSVTSITIPDSVTSITIPDSVTRIGDFAFSGCSSLTSITIPDSVTSIGDDAFSYCRSLTSITIPDRVTSIGNLAFYDCSGLTSITIPNGVTSIGESAFSYCRSLTSITIPDSVTSIGDAAFKYCSNLKTISLSCKSSLKKSDFGDQANLVSYTLHTLKKTEAKAATCSEDGNIEYWTCEHCKKYFLSDDSNPETAKAVEQSETVIPALKHKNATTRGASEPTETEPGYSGDRYCPDCNTVLEKGYTYWNEDNLTWTLDADGTLTIRSPAYNNSKVKKIVIEDGVTSIGDDAFYNCSNLTSITIPKNVTSIGNSVFENCSSLTDITIPDSVTSIGNWAFLNCSSLTSITIPDSVTSIGNTAFYNCSGLTSITIPDSVTSIGDSVFSDCANLKTISLSCKSSLKRSDFGEQADLVSYTNQHILTKTEAKTATCTEDGNKAYWTCEHCKKYFLSDDTNPETAKAVELSETVIPASHKLTKVEAKDATCTEDGNKAYWTCEHCGKYFLSDDTNPETAKAVELSETVISASHKLTKVEAKAATYAENGNKAYWTCEHCKKYFLSDDTNPETATAVELSETVIPALVQVATTTTPIKCVYGQDMNKIDLRDYVQNTDVVGEVTVKVATGSTLPDGMKLDNGKISGKPAKAYEDSKEVTFTFTAENGSTENLTLLFLVAKADPTVEVSVSGDSHTEGDLVSELKLILSENSTKGVVELVSEIKALVAGKNTFTWKFTPEDENNYNMVTGTVVVNAQTTTTTTTTTKATTTTTKATTTTKPSKTTTTKATTTTKPNKTTTTKVTTTTKPNKTTTTKVTTTTKPSKTTTTNATTTTKPSKTTTTKVTTTTKPNKTTTTKATTTTKPSKTTTTKATTTTKPSKTTTTKATTTTKPSKTTTTNATTTTKPSKTTTTKATTTTKPSKATTTKVTTTTTTAIPSYGDVNLDGKVDIVDAIFLNKYLATLIQFSDAQVANADCYQDGVLNDQDTIALMQFIILLIDDLPVQPTEK